MNTAEYPYQAEWEKYKRLRNRAFLTPFLPGFLMFPIDLISVVFRISLFPAGIFGGAASTAFLCCYIGAIGYTQFQWRKFKCPRCLDQFHKAAFFIRSPMERSECKNCGFAKFEGSKLDGLLV